MIFVVAILQRGVDGEGFHIVAFPAANERARFLWREDSNEDYDKSEVDAHQP